MNWLLSAIIFLPLVGGIVVMLLPERLTRWTAAIITLGVFALTLWLYFGLLINGSSFGTVANPAWKESYDWINITVGDFHFQLRYELGTDGLSMPMIILNGLLSFLAVVSSWHIEKRIKFYMAMILVLEFGVMGVFAAFDLFLFFLFWEVMLIPMAFLIGIWGHERRIYAAVKFVLYTMAGSILMLVGILWLYNATGTFDLTEIQRALQTGALVLPAQTEMLLFLAFFVAFAIKVPLFPVHTWLPDAHVEAPTAGSVILAGVLLKMGTYGMMRFCLPLFPGFSRKAAPYVAVLAIIGIIYGALVALVQPNLKKLVAYSSVSHLGFVVLGIFSFTAIGMQGAIFQMLAHGISTGALFLLVGMLYDRRHTFEIAQYGGLATPMPRLSAFFLFAVLSSLGLPMLNGFIGEYLILLGTYIVHWQWTAWAATGVILSACYLLWSYQRVFYGAVTVEKNKTLPDASERERFILATMCAVILWMGIGSAFLTKRTAEATNTIRKQMERQQWPAEASAPARALHNGAVITVNTLERSSNR